MLFSFIEISFKCDKKIKSIVMWFFTCLFIVISSLRNGTSGDRLAYYEFFNSLDGFISGLNNFRNFEPFYVLLNVIVKMFTNNYYIFQFAEAVIVMLCYRAMYAKGILPNHEYEYSMTMMFIVWALGCGGIYVIRSTIACAIIINSYPYIVKRELKKFLLYALIACGFHLMSIIWLPAYFIYNFKLKNKNLIFIIILCVIFNQRIMDTVTFILDRVTPQVYRRIYSYLARDSADMYGVHYSYFEYILKGTANMIFLVILFYFITSNVQISKEDKDILIGCNRLYFIGCFIYLFAMIYSTALSRAALPYNMSQYFILPYLFSCFKKTHNKMIVFIPFACYLTLRCYVQLNSGLVDFSFLSVFK